MTERVVAAQRESAPLLRISALKTCITAIGVRAELIHIPKALIERLLVWKPREASIADSLIPIELHLERLMEPSRTNEINPQIPTQTDLLLNAEVVLVVIRCFECSTRERVQADCQRTGRRARLNSSTGSAAGTKDRLERMVRICRRVDCTSSDAGGDADAADLAPDATNERRIVGRVHRGKIGNLHGNDVAENSKAAMNRQPRSQLIGEGNSRLINEQWRGGKQVVGISHYHFVQRFIGVV